MEQILYDVAVIGGGASGMMAAICAAGKGARTILMEHNSRVGKKLLSTGNGKCNFTNERQEEACYYSGNPAFVTSALRLFGKEETVRFFEDLGLLVSVKHGCYYPNSGQAASVLDALRFELERLRVPVLCDAHVASLHRQEHFLIEIKRPKQEFLSAKNCILATGGKAAAQTGSDGSGYQLARQFGHRILGPVPALVPLVVAEKGFSALAGVRTKARLCLKIQNEPQAVQEGELQLTAYGISGIPVFQFSRIAANALQKKKKVTVQIDFLPDETLEWLEQELIRRQQGRHQDHTLEEAMTGVLNKKIVTFLRKQAKIRAEETMGQLYRRQITAYAGLIKNYEVEITETKPFANAQVTAGGVDLAQVKEDSMESKLAPGLFFAGELLDVDGICGGYNLQWAWTSGYLAGCAAAGRIK